MWSKFRTCSHGCQERVRNPMKKIFGYPNKGGLAKNPYNESETLTVSCRVILAWSERVSLYIRQIMILPRKKNRMQPSRAPCSLSDSQAAVILQAPPHILVGTICNKMYLTFY